MAKCDVCGKGVTFGIKVSHSHRRTNRAWKPNVRRVKAVVEGAPKHINVCTAARPNTLSPTPYYGSRARHGWSGGTGLR